MLKNNSDIFFKNFRIIEQRLPKIAEKIKLIEIPENFEIIQTKSNLNTLRINLEDGTKFLIHSSYDPLKEASNIIKNYLKDKYDVLILGGFGLGFLAIQSLKEKKADKIIVIEKDLRIFKAAICANDLTEILSSDDVIFLFETDNEIEGLTDVLLNISTKKVYTLIHPQLLKIYPEFYSNLKNIIDSYLARKNINIATLTRFQTLWMRNIFKNHKLFLQNKGIKNFFDKYKNVPALIISAGPSLSDEINSIKENQNKFIIISVDSCLTVLINNGIKPDFVVSVDPQYINYKYFEYLKDFTSILVAEPSVFYLIPKNYKGKIIFFSSVFPFVKWLENFAELKGEIDMGGSVSTTAFDFAYKMGCNPLILVGQDLAFIKERTHTKGSYVEKYWIVRYSKFNTIYNGIYKYIHNNLFIKIRSNSGEMVNTDKRLLVFHSWFENKIKKIKNEKEVFNTSLMGAKISDCKVIKLDEIIKKYNFKNIENLKNELKLFNDKIENEIFEKNYKLFKEKIFYIKEKLFHLLEIIENGVKYSEKLYEKIEKKKLENINEILKKLEKIDEQIKEYSMLTEFISIMIQDVIHTVLEDYEDYLNEIEKKDEQLKIAKKNLFLYKGIKNAIKNFINLCALL